MQLALIIPINVPDNTPGLGIGGQLPTPPVYPSGGLPVPPSTTLPIPPSVGVTPPIFYPGDPAAGLPPVVGWPLPTPPGTGTGGQLPEKPGRPPEIGGGPASPPGYVVVKPPIHISAHPENGLPPMIGWELPPEFCSPTAAPK
jgi:hypothetical protein